MNQEKKSLELPKLKLGWDEGRTERLLAEVHTRLDRRRRAMRAAFGAAALASVVAVAWTVRYGHVHTNASSPIDPGGQVAAQRSFKLLEGSEIELDPATSEVRVVEESPSRVRVDVVRGAGRYSVVPNASRTFEVHSGPVTVTVVGTEFTVEQRAEGTWVEVFRGKVRVGWGTDEAFVAAGEKGIFPPNAPPALAQNLAEAPRDDGDAPAVRSPQATQAYRSRVARHDYRGAYAVLSRNPGLAGDTVEELLVAADVARLSDHPSEALPYLQRVIREHPHDERAPLAAFTLGRTLGGLGRMQEAMAMFGRVRTSWPKSPLAEDALLRQAETASQMGDLATARRIAEQYDRDYPSGRRRAEVRRYARLD
jgi:transmembrane sensor